MMYPGYYPTHYFGFGFDLFSFILTVLFWWIVIMLAIKLIKWMFQGHDESQEDSNIEIVRERYAKGEIKKKEYEQLMKDLS